MEVDNRTAACQIFVQVLSYQEVQPRHESSAAFHEIRLFMNVFSVTSLMIPWHPSSLSCFALDSPPHWHNVIHSYRNLYHLCFYLRRLSIISYQLCVYLVWIYSLWIICFAFFSLHQFSYHLFAMITSIHHISSLH